MKKAFTIFNWIVVALAMIIGFCIDSTFISFILIAGGFAYGWVMSKLGFFETKESDLA